MLFIAGQAGSRFPLHAIRRGSPLDCRRSVIAMAKDALAEADKTGAFKRTDATFRSQVVPGSEFEPEGAPAVGLSCALPPRLTSGISCRHSLDPRSHSLELDIQSKVAWSSHVALSRTICDG